MTLAEGTGGQCQELNQISLAVAPSPTLPSSQCCRALLAHPLAADGKLMNDFTGRVRMDERTAPKGTVRTITVALDTAQYQVRRGNAGVCACVRGGWGAGGGTGGPRCVSGSRCSDDAR